MKFQHPIICRNCFRKFSASRAWFKCMMHRPAVEFNPSPGRFMMTGLRNHIRYDQAVCDDRHITSFRICPGCKADLPHYAGKERSSVIAVAGARTTGKTLYSVALLKYLIERSASEIPGLVPMFDDEGSYQWFTELYQELAILEDEPDPTDFNAGDPDPDPIAVRLYRWGSKNDKSNPLSFLTLYDPPGEIFKSLENVKVARYLASAGTIILLVDPHPLRSNSDEAHGDSPFNPARVLNALVTNIREETNLSEGKQVGKRLCVMLTKCDQDIFEENPALMAPPEPDEADLGRTAINRFLDTKREHLKYVNHTCKRLLSEWGQDRFLTFARNEFKSVTYFACSSMQNDPSSNRPVLKPVGVADPLFRLYHGL